MEGHRSGRYRIRLRRWPAESGLALTDGTPAFETTCSGKPEPAGVALPIAQGLLDVDGYQHRRSSGDDDRTAITFEIELAAGRHEIRGAFADARNTPVCSAYYAEVEYCGG